MYAHELGNTVNRKGPIANRVVLVFGFARFCQIDLLQLNTVHPFCAVAMKEPPAIHTSWPEEDDQYGRSYQA